MTASDAAMLDGRTDDVTAWRPHDLHGPRLLLRPLARSDADALVSLRA